MDDFQPSWSSRKKIAFTSDRDGDTEIYTMRPDGSQLRKLTSNKTGDEFPNWSPSGRTVFFHREAKGSLDVYRVRARGGGIERLTTHAGGDGLPAPSPNGRMVAFASERKDDRLDLYTMRAGGGGQVKRITDGVFDFVPDWGVRP